MDKTLLISLAKRLNLTDLEPDQEEFILSSQESELAILNAITVAKRHFEWKMANAGFKAIEIVQKVAEVDWRERINKDEVLQRANSNKHYGIWQEQQRQKELADKLKKKLELQEKYTAKNM